MQLSETVDDALRAARSGGAAVLVIDRMLHGEDGLSIIETLRGEGNDDAGAGDQRALVRRRTH